MSDSTLTDPIDLSIIWSNESGFDNVRRLKFTRKFNDSIKETKILTRAADFENGYFNNNRDGLSISFMIERNTANIGIHKLNMYYSMSDSGELWFDLIGKTLIQNITTEHVQQNFDELAGKSLAFSPTFEDGTGFVSGISGERLKYKIKNKLDVFLFDESPLEFVTGSDDAFVIRKENQYLSVGTTGEISWVDVYESATPLYRISMTMQDGVELKLIMNGKTTDDLLLYKSSANEPAKFIRFENITEYGKAHMRILDISTAKYEIPSGYKEINYDSQNYRGDYNEDACYHFGNCINDASCKGFAIVAPETERRYVCSPRTGYPDRINCSYQDVTTRNGGCVTYHGDGDNKAAMRPKEIVYNEF